MDFIELWTGGPRFAQAEHFKLGTDCIVLSDFVNTNGAKKGIDLGCASGAIAMFLLCKTQKLHMTGLELQSAAVEVARENMRLNGFEDRSTMVCGDIRCHRELFPSGSFDIVVSNPPYFPLGSGTLSPDSARAAARGETDCSLEDLCRAAKYLCRWGGTFSIVHKPERLSEALCTMTAFGFEPKRLRLVCHTAAAAPGLVLIEAKRGGKPGLKIEPNLILRLDNGEETAEAKRIYHRP